MVADSRDVMHGIRRCSSAPGDLSRPRDHDFFTREDQTATQGPPRETDEDAVLTGEAAHPLEKFEEVLQKQAYLDEHSKELYYTYKTIKDVPGFHVLRSLVYVDGFFEAMALKLSDSDREIVTFGSLLHELEEFLQKSPEKSFRLCLLNDVIPQSVRFRPQWSLPNPFSRPSAGRRNVPTPVQAIILAFERTLGLGATSIYKWGSITNMLTRVGRTISQLPSLSKTTVPTSPEPLLQWTYTRLYWFKDFELYSSDLAVYISQIHLQPLKPLGATICVSAASPRGIDVCIVCRSSKPEVPDTTPVLSIQQELYSYIPATLRECTTPHVKTLSTIHSVYGLLIRDTSTFIDRLSSELEYLWAKGKHKPSVDKMNYTLYLSEGSKACQRELLQALLKLEGLKYPLPLPREAETAGRALEEWQIAIRADIEYLGNQLEDIDSRNSQLRTMIKEQLDLRQFRLSTPLAILAAIYLPFSFVCTFFGMNISDPLWGTESKDASPITKTSNDTSSLTLSQNQTDTIVTAIATSGSHLFTFKEFLYVAIIITVITLGIPLLGAKILRSTIRFVKRNTGYLLLLWILILIGFLVAWPLLLIKTIGVYMIQFAFGAYSLLFRLRSWAPFRFQLKQNWEKRWMIYLAVTTLCVQNPATGYDYWVLIPPPIATAIFLSKSTHFQFRVRPMWTRIKTYRPNYLHSSQRKQWKWALLAGSIILAVGFDWIPILADQFTSSLYGTYLGLYGIDKLRSVVRAREGLKRWVGFLLVVGGCIACDSLILYCVTLPVIPVLYLVAWSLYFDDQEFIKKHLPEWMDFRRRKRAEPADVETGSGIVSVPLQQL